jgi:hypothetical protein
LAESLSRLLASKRVMNTDGVSPLADSILYLSSLLRAGSRPIDRYIDYFGEHGTATPFGRLGGGVQEGICIGGAGQPSVIPAWRV